MNLATVLAAHAVRAAALLGLTLALMPLFRQARAETRRLVLALGLGGALVLPALSALAPATLALHPPRSSFLVAVAEPLVAAGVAVRNAAEAAPLAALGEPAAAPPATHLGQVLSALWAAGALLLVARLVAGLVRARAMVRRSSEAPSWRPAALLAAARTGVTVDVRATDELEGPAVAGLFRPTILVPEASSGWSEERRLAVLLHETAHVTRRDCLVQALGQLTCAAHWFDPLAWNAMARLRREREIAADDAVLEAGVRPSSYAAALLSIATGPVPVGAIGMAARRSRESELGARVKAILTAGRARGPLPRPQLAILVACASLVLLAIACATPGRDGESVGSGSPNAVGFATTTPAAAKAASREGSSSLDPTLQAIAEQELDRTLDEWKGVSGVVVILDPSTGEVLADAGRDHGARADVATSRSFVTGSTLKTLALAAALEEGAVTLADRFDCEHGSRAYAGHTLKDSTSNGVLGLGEMLAVSTNVGFSKLGDRLGAARFERWLRRFHFEGVPTDIEEHGWDAAWLVNGEVLSATPLQVVAAYGAIANGGVYLAPSFSRQSPSAGERVLKAETAHAVLGLLEEAVKNENTTSAKARLANARVAGKTGTAEFKLPDGTSGGYASFVGVVPANQPRFVILVGVESPREGGYGGTVAAPAFARVASRALGG